MRSNRRLRAGLIMLGVALTAMHAHAGSIVTARSGGTSTNKDSKVNGGGTTVTRGNVTLNAGTGRNVVISTVRSGTAATLRVTATNNASLTKTGSGTLVLSGNNMFTGATMVHSGSLTSGGSSSSSSSSSTSIISSGASLAMNALVFTGTVNLTSGTTTPIADTTTGTLVLTPGTTVVPSGQTPGPGTITLVGPGALTMSPIYNVGTIALSTNIAIMGSGTLMLSSAGALNSPLNLKAVLHPTEPGTAFSESNPVTLITDSPEGAAFPTGTTMRVVPQVANGSTAVGTIINNTGITLAIKPSALLEGGLMIVRP